MSISADKIKTRENSTDKVLISHENYGIIKYSDLDNRYFQFDKSSYQSPQFIFP